MRKILIIMSSLELGGAERSLIGMLQTIDYSKVSVDLFLNAHNGELFSQIPKEVNLLPEIEEYTYLAKPLSLTIKKGHILIAASRLFAKFLAKIKGSENNAGISGDYLYKYSQRFLPRISDMKYDVVISYIFPHYFFQSKVFGKKRVAWIHTDYTNIKIDYKSQLKMWEKADSIAAVSKSVAESFSCVFPQLREKIFIFENILPKRFVVDAAKNGKADDMSKNSRYTFLSIGRFCEAKNFSNIPTICKYIVKSGYDIKWYLIGFGGEEELIRNNIIKANMENHVFVLGKKDNPYPYIKKCDYYIQPSIYEGKAVTVREAQMLEKPVIITDFETAPSQVIDGYDGVIVPIENSECAEGIIRLLRNEKMTEQLRENCRLSDFSNSSEIEKLYQLVYGDKNVHN